MTKSIPATHFNPEVLKWARKLYRMSRPIAAEKLGVEVDILTAWESGSEVPTVAKLRQVAETYGVATAAFFMPEPPETLDEVPDRRTLPGIDRGLPFELMREVRDIKTRQEVARELIETMDLDVEPFDLRIRKSLDTARAARVLREALGVTLEEQFAASGAYGGFNLWRQAVERAGVMVCQLSYVDLSVARGIALFDEVVPALAVNAKDTPNGRLFSLAHEVVHLALRRSALCDATLPGGRTGAGVEAFCNAVAGCMLVPPDALTREPLVAEHPPTVDWSSAEIGALARRFGVSEDVIARRLVDYALMSKRDYRSHRARLASRQSSGSRSGGDYYRNVVSKQGRPYIGLVFEAYARDHITATTASRYLGVRVNHLSKLRARLGESA